MTRTRKLLHQFPGGTLRSAERSGLVAMEQTWKAGTFLPRHCHDHAWFTFLFAGNYVEHLPSFERTCHAGMVIWHPPGLVHENHFADGGHNFNLAFDVEWLEKLPPDLRLSASTRVWQGGTAYLLGLQLYRRLNLEGYISDENAMNLIVLAASSPIPDKPRWMARVLELMNDEYAGAMTLVRAAERASVHPVHLSRSFRHVFGCTFREYLRLIRLYRATDLLKRSSADITEIAFSCGFSDHAHLTRTLKRATGLTPSAYRARTR